MARLPWNALSLLLSVALGAIAPAQCPECTKPLSCAPEPAANNFNTSCPNELTAAIVGLLELGLAKNNMALLIAADCLSLMAGNQRIYKCSGLGSKFMETRADCINESVSPPRYIWCADPVGDSPHNCICINIDHLDGCDVSFGGGDPLAKTTILAAALAHEACHAKSGEYSSDAAGVTYTPPCSFILNEIGCLSLELQVLNCVLAFYPNNVPLQTRRNVVAASMANWQQQKVANGC